MKFQSQLPHRSTSLLSVRRIVGSVAQMKVPLIACGVIVALLGTIGVRFASADTINTTDFVITVKTDNAGTSNSTSFTIPTSGGGYNYGVDWNNDGVVDQANITGNVTHDFGTAGTYTIRISGTFPAIYFANTGDRLKLLSVDQWGTGVWRTMQNAFYGCANLTSSAADAPNLSQVTNMSYMFGSASAFNGDISNWNVSNVTNMSSMFSGARAFNQPLNDWDVSKLTSMSSMFYGATAFNQPLNNWNTASVTSMNSTFYGATAFNGDISTWDTSSVTNMQIMFYKASAFNGDISNWNVSNVTDTSYMFGSASAFNGDISNWNVSNVTNMSYMFSGATAFNQPLNDWDVSKVTNMISMFSNAYSFNQPLSTWNVGNVTNMGSMFSGARVFNGTISNWNTSKVTNMSEMFSGATAFNQPLNDWDVSKVTNMYSTFYRAGAFNQPLNSWNMSSVMSASNMLDYSKLSLANYDATLSGWAAQTLRTNVTLGASPLKYCAAQSARASMIATYNWTIAGDSLGCPPPTVTITAPTKLKNSTITDTTIRVEQTYPTVTVNAADVSIAAATTAGYSNLNCTQTTATQVDCTVHITSSGTLRVAAVNSAGVSAAATETGYIVDTIAPTSNVSIDSSTGVHTPTVSFTATDNIAVSRVDILYYADNGGAGVNPTRTTLSSAASPVSLTLDPDETVHEIIVRTYDTAGNITDNTVRFPPIITYNAPTVVSNAAINNATVTITTPSGNNISNITLNNGGTGASLTNCTGSNGGTTAPYAQPVTCSLPGITTSGTVRINATDAGNGAVGNNQQVFVIETTAPVITVDAPKKVSNTAITNTVVTITDNHALRAADVTIDAVNKTAGFAVSNVSCTQVNTSTVSCSLQVDGTVGTGDLRVQVRDLAGNTATQTETGYIIDTAAPTVTINRATSQQSPTNVNEAYFTIVFSEPVQGFHVGAIELADSTGYVTELTTTDNKTFTAKVVGMTDGDTVVATIPADAVTDVAGNKNAASTSTANTVHYDATAPSIVVTPKTVNSPTPQLKGVIDDPTATIVVTIQGNDYTAVNHGDGTWSLDLGTVTPALTDGTYTVTATATDTAGNSGSDVKDITIDTTTPTGTINAVAPSITNSPELTGTVNDPTATVTVAVDGNTYTATNNGDGTWSLSAGTINPALSAGDHSIDVTFTDSFANKSTATTTVSVLRSDADAPTVNAVKWTGGRPVITGTYDSANTVTLRVTVNGTVYTLGTDAQLSVSGDTWRLDLTDRSPSLAPGIYEVTAASTTRDGSVIRDTTTAEVTILEGADNRVEGDISAPNTGIQSLSMRLVVWSVAVLSFLSIAVVVTRRTLLSKS